MLLTLRLHNFRCFPSLHWEIPAQGAILIGDNAQGKTSILEALCFALSLHSPRCSRLEKLASHGTHNFGIALDTSEEERRIRWKPKNLQLQNQGNICKDYADYLQSAPPIAWLGNKDIALVQTGAEARRNYLDFLGSQWHPAYRQALQIYRKTLRSRNALLKNPRHSQEALRSFSTVLAEHGEILVKLRTALIARLQNYIRSSHHQISGSKEEITITYQPSCDIPLMQAFEQSITSDERMGYTTMGPQRDDFILNIAGKAASDYASEGQQRTLATALQLGQANLLSDETGQAPILLIDDIFGELDAARRTALLQSLPSDSQIIITTTQLDWLGDAPSPLPIFHVKQGKLESAH